MRWPARRRKADAPPAVDERGVPDLRAFRQPPEHYRELHRKALRDGDFHLRTHASWGLIARGEESLPLLLSMLSDGSAESREDAAGALGWLGSERPDVVSALIAALTSAEGDEERYSLLGALGALRSRAALPAVAAVLRDDSADHDTRHAAAEALGRIVRRRFDRQPDPVAAATRWLDEHDGSS